MSESPLSEDGPDDSILENELRQVVRNIYETGDLVELTVKRVRNAAEKNLDLRDGFFKESQWKDKSKAIIEAEATSAAEAEKSAVEPSPVKPSKPTAKSLKRSSPDDSQPKKRRKTDEREDSEDKAIAEGNVPTACPKITSGSRKVSSSESELSEVAMSDSESSGRGKADPKSDTKPAKGKAAACATIKKKKDDAFESEMSDVIDDQPAPKRKRQRPTSKDSRPKPASSKPKAKKNSSSSPNLDPDAEEIKRLQGWLVKCGIRKMWARELKPYDGRPKDKIRHLKRMLADAGMTGRFSADKAAQIREARELQADLEAVQEGARHWGKKSGSEADEADDGEGAGGAGAAARPRRRLAKGLEGLDFLNDDDGEDSG